jgi:signal transduction histidine kinase
MLDRGMKKTIAIAAAWLPFLALWQMFAMQAGATFARALPFSLFAIASAATLGLLVSRFCARMALPDELRVSFYAAHVLAAAIYAVVWASGMFVFDRIVDGKLAPRTFVVMWLVEGVWLYAIAAGFSYAMLTQRRVLQAEKNLAVARLDALRSRLHPHFLFNALHTVSALVRHDPAEAEGAVEKLGDMLRYTLRDGEGDVVPFAEEWEFTRRYLEFEQLRYGDRLRVVSEIDPRSLTCSAPSFALQTLVENSVRHSISRRAEGGRVEISARVGGDRLHIRVRDDGGNGVASEPGSQYGLSALRERLEVVYGSRLNVSRNDTGFEVEFSVPCTPSDGDDDE